MTNKHNNIEKHIHFVASHYKPNAFDTRKGWEKMEKHMGFQPKTRGLSFWYPAVAAVAIIAVVSVVLFHLNRKEILTAEADHTLYSLHDSTRVDMQKGAELTYDKHFGEKDRKVSMRGQITFNVARDKNRPFIISTPTAQVKVLGTSFTVNEDEKGTRLNVHSGVVEFTPQDPIIPILCTAGVSVHYTAEKELIEVTSKESSITINGSEKSLSFTNTPLKDVTLILSHYFNENIQLSQEEAQIPFTSSFTDKSIIEILNIINVTLDTHLTIRRKSL